MKLTYVILFMAVGLSLILEAESQQCASYSCVEEFNLAESECVELTLIPFPCRGQFTCPGRLTFSCPVFNVGGSACASGAFGFLVFPTSESDPTERVCGMFTPTPVEAEQSLTVDIIPTPGAFEEFQCIVECEGSAETMSTPDTTTPGTYAPDTTPPCIAMSETTTPGTYAPDTTPSTTMSDTTTPGTTMSETTTPETMSPDPTTVTVTVPSTRKPRRKVPRNIWEAILRLTNLRGSRGLLGRSLLRKIKALSYRHRI